MRMVAAYDNYLPFVHLLAVSEMAFRLCPSFCQSFAPVVIQKGSVVNFRTWISFHVLFQF